MPPSSKLNSLLLFGVIPLFIAVYAEKVDFIVAIDLSVWLAAVFALFYLLRTPWRLYFLIQTKTKELEEKEKRGFPPNSRERDHLITLSTRMLGVAWATPFIAIAGWFGLAEYCSRYQLNSMTELIHPYFILFIGLAGGLIPVRSYYNQMKQEFVIPMEENDEGKESEVVQTVLDQLVQREGIIKRLTKSVQQEIDKVQENIKRHDREVHLLKKACKADSEAKFNEITRLERKVIGIENQVELIRILNQEKEEEPKSLLAAIFRRKWF